MRKIYKYVIVILASLLLIWFSLDIQNLEKHRSAIKPASFSATQYAENFWKDSLPVCISNAPLISDFVQLLNENPGQAFEKYGRKLGISSSYYFILKGTGTIEKVEDEFLILAVDDQTKVRILTDFIYGNAVRDGSGKVNINNFLNMTDFNNVSVAINKLVKEKVASRLKITAKTGQQLEFAGAVEINEENIDLTAASIIPISAKLVNGKSE